MKLLVPPVLPFAVNVVLVSASGSSIGDFSGPAHWKHVSDYSEYQCRNITVPYQYELPNAGNNTGDLDPYSDSTIDKVERRLVSGSPLKHV
jgi:hypothetical protein